MDRVSLTAHDRAHLHQIHAITVDLVQVRTTVPTCTRSTVMAWNGISSCSSRQSYRYWRSSLSQARRRYCATRYQLGHFGRERISRDGFKSRTKLSIPSFGDM